MQIVLLGHGKMGRLVESLAVADGHTVARAFGSADAVTADALAGADVAIDFSVAEATPGHIRACVAAGVPVVVGTTGWQDAREAVEADVRAGRGAVVVGANFSVGVAVFARLAAEAARLFARAGGYAPFLEEQHHAAKRDAPSGTALMLRERVAAAFPDEGLDVAVTRAGHIPGTHRVGFDGPPDTVVLEHVARSREGFARGALVAATWLVGQAGASHTGVWTFDDVMADVLGSA